MQYLTKQLLLTGEKKVSGVHQYMRLKKKNLWEADLSQLLYKTSSPNQSKECPKTKLFFQ